MPIPWLVMLIVGVLISVVSYMLMPKPKGPKPPELEDFQFPTADANRARPVVFGSMEVKGGNMLSEHDRARSSNS